MRATATVFPADLQNILVLCGICSRASYIRRRGVLARPVAYADRSLTGEGNLTN